MGSDGYLDPYRESAQRHGVGFGVTLWANEKSQRLRFDVFSQMCYLPGKRLLDAGCSRGDLAAHLVERGIEYGSYVGIDALPNVIEFAQGRKLPRAEFVCGDFITHGELLRHGKPQIVIISGALNTMADEQVYRTLESAWSAAGEALAFNFLSDRCGPGAPPQDTFARRLDTIELLRWATDKSPYVSFRQDYFQHGHDATIVIRRAK